VGDVQVKIDPKSLPYKVLVLLKTKGKMPRREIRDNLNCDQFALSSGLFHLEAYGRIKCIPRTLPKVYEFVSFEATKTPKKRVHDRKKAPKAILAFEEAGGSLELASCLGYPIPAIKATARVVYGVNMARSDE
jgi:hypothetical protein